MLLVFLALEALVRIHVLTAFLFSPFAFASYTTAIFGWDKTVDIIKRSVPADEHCPASPSKWILVGHSMGTMVIENVSASTPFAQRVTYPCLAEKDQLRAVFLPLVAYTP